MRHHVLMASGDSQVEYIDSSLQQNGATGSSISINTPAAAQDGDLLVVFLMTNLTGSSTWTASGWTEVLDRGSAPNMAVAYKTRNSADGSSYSFTNSSSLATLCGGIIALRSAAYDTIGTVATGASPIAAPSINVSSAGSLLIGFFATDSNTSISTPSGMTQRITDSSGAPKIAVFTEGVAAGSTGTRSSTIGTASVRGGVLLAAKPA